MKKHLLFLLLIFFLFPSISKATCSYQQQVGFDTIVVDARIAPHGMDVTAPPVWDGSKWVGQPYIYLFEGDTFYVILEGGGTLYSYIWQDDGTNYWAKSAQYGVGQQYWYSYDPSTLGVGYPTEHPSIAYPEGCPDCSQQRANLAVQCLGEENIINWDSLYCTGECSTKERNFGGPPCPLPQ